jgi:hypothetical protein
MRQDSNSPPFDRESSLLGWMTASQRNQNSVTHFNVTHFNVTHFNVTHFNVTWNSITKQKLF